MGIRRSVITCFVWSFCLFLVQFVPGAVVAVEPDAFDVGLESVALALRVKTVQARGLQPAPRHRRTGSPPARPLREGQALAASGLRLPVAIPTAYLPRRSAAGDHSSTNPGEDH